jgi:hypothetical protein
MKNNRFTLYIANDQVEDFETLLEKLGEKGKSLSGEIKPAIEALISEHVKKESAA